jgi:hypothetical protein
MRTLYDDPRLNRLPEAWAEASARVEQGPQLECLTAEQIVTFLETSRSRSVPAEQRAARALAEEHLAECSFCAREVATLFRARRAREARLRARVALGEGKGRVAACIRVAVEQAWGAFTVADALLSGLGRHVRLDGAFPDLGLAAVRGNDDGPADEEDRLHDVTVSGEGFSPTEILLSKEEEGGGITLILRERLEVRLLTPDGRSEEVPVEDGDDGYVATITGLPEGEYCVALLHPEEGSPSPP